MASPISFTIERQPMLDDGTGDGIDRADIVALFVLASRHLSRTRLHALAISAYLIAGSGEV